MDLQKQVLEYLVSERIFHYRQASGGSSSSQAGFHRFGPKEAPDIICVIKGQYIGIELKAHGQKQTENQEEFQRALEAAGGKYVLAFSLEDAKRALGSPSISSQ